MSEHIIEDKISFSELVQRFSAWVLFLWSKRKAFLIIGLAGGLAGFLYTFKKVTYTAETTFTLESGTGGMSGDASGLASLVGIDIGSLAGGAGGAFEGENIIELYKSQRLLERALLKNVTTVEQDSFRLIDRFIAERKYDKKWSEELAQVDFSVPRAQFSKMQDSLMYELVEDLRDYHVSAEKVSRKLNIISVKVSAKDPLFARYFNEQLVKEANQFYYETKTKKTSDNVAVLQQQTDSVRRVLDESLLGMAQISERNPNPNALNKSQQIPAQQAQIDMRTATAAYTELVKNLEMAKLNNLKNAPIIQVIDTPRKYLDNNRVSKLKGIVIGGLLAGILTFIYLTGSWIIRGALQAEKSKE
ncbi:exopolysaccharide biosynthesis protein [Penaeicola halotolerans]|uniref:exopolysaccharide biosynthesis protein n=1 Tax=Penaeicola halotolerans TaxID=2793196 RepID=UPI001CF8B241|nr:exopolysaccharide biosynthesis protein [Penaeicola halotolerans]